MMVVYIARPVYGVWLFNVVFTTVIIARLETLRVLYFFDTQVNNVYMSTQSSTGST